MSPYDKVSSETEAFSIIGILIEFIYNCVQDCIYTNAYRNIRFRQFKKSTLSFCCSGLRNTVKSTQVKQSSSTEKKRADEIRPIYLVKANANRNDAMPRNTGGNLLRMNIG